MKLTQKQQLDLAEEFLNGFTSLLKTYLVKMNLPFTPVSALKYNEKWQDTLTLSEMITVVDADLMALFPNLHKGGVRSKSRKRDLVLRRQVLCVLGRDIELNLGTIGKELGIDHATVIHSIKNINSMLDTGNTEATRVFREINNLIRDYYFTKYGKDISETDDSGDNS